MLTLVVAYCIASPLGTTCHSAVAEGATSPQMCATAGVLVEERITEIVEAHGFIVSVDWQCVAPGVLS